MLKEYSYGAVVYKTDEGGPLFLLVKSAGSGRWGFPKGHIEKGESAIAAAKREILEETGIGSLRFIDGLEQEDVYLINGARAETAGRTAEKHSVYFLAQALAAPAGRRDEEISELRWACIEAAMELLHFENQKNALRLAYKKINEQDLAASPEGLPGGKNGKSAFKRRDIQKSGGRGGDDGFGNR